MSSLQLPASAIPKPLPEDDDDVSWALQTAAVQWGRGAYQDALVWLRRAAESAIELSAWSRAADLNATATRLEKQLSRGHLPPVSVESQMPSAPPRHAVLPSFPVPATSAPPAGSFGPLSGTSRQTTGYSSMPPQLGGDFASQRPSAGFSGRSSVVIDVEESELELSDDEIRELESENIAGSDIPTGTRPPTSAAAPSSQYPALRRSSSDFLPAFSLESSRPIQEQSSRRLTPAAMTSTSGLPAFSLDSGARSHSPSSAVPARPGVSSLPAFPLEPTASTLPPVSKWPRFGSPGTSHLPPSPALPTFEAPAPSRPFVNDGEDGAPGLEEPQLEDLEPLSRDSRDTSRDTSGYESRDETPSLGDLDLVDPDRARDPRRTNPSPVGPAHLPPVRSGLPSPRPLRSSVPLPAALPESRSKSSKPILVRAERVQAPPPPPPPPPPSATSSVPARAPGGSIEPRMPKRTLSYASPLDFGKPDVSDRASSPRPSARAAASMSDRVVSSAPTVRNMPVADAVSIPPATPRSVAPEDLPTVSSPSLSRPPASDTDRPGVALRRSGAPYSESKRLSFKFEESPSRATSTRSELEHDSSASAPSSIKPGVVPSERVEASLIQDEPLAVLPPVTTRLSAESTKPSSDDVVLSGVRLAEVRGFSDLPASAHRLLAKTARIESLNTGEEASFFSVALVLDGWVGLMPAIADNACATAVVGEVVFTEGTLADGLMLRVVAGQDDVVVATWDSDAIVEATKDCPWVADDLKLLADGFQALAGACLGPLGDRLDDSLRSIVTSRCEIRTLLPGEQLCAAGKTVPGMHIIGGGDIELVDENGRVTKTHGTGEFLFAPQVLAGGLVPFSARAGTKGALVLFAPRMAAHELLVSVPPLLEILAD